MFAFRRAVVAALLLLPRVYALDPQKQLSQYGLESWQARQGIANGGILCIAQSADGYLWLGTRLGLVRFNGVEFQLYDRKASGGLIGWNVNHIETRRDGSVLFSTEGGAGMVEYRAGKFTAYPLPKLPVRGIRVFHEARDGSLWIGTNGSGLMHFSGGKLHVFAAAEDPGSTIKAITETRDGSIWVGSYGDGVTRFQNGAAVRFTVRQGLPSNDVRAILEDPDGSMWFSTLGGLARLREGHWTVFARGQGLSHERAFPLTRDRDGNLWIGTEGGGLNRMTAGRFSALTSKSGLTSDEIRCTFEDREGNLWFGTSDGSLFRLRDEKFTVFTSREGLRSDLVRAVFEDRDRNIWVGTGDGINYLHDGQVLRPVEAWGNGTVTSILRDRAGVLWIGTLGKGLRRVQGRQVQVYFPDRIVSSLLEHRDGTIWAGVVPGLVRIKNGKTEQVGLGTPLAGVRTGALRQDANGTVWATSDAGTIYRINSLENGFDVKAYPLENSGCSTAVTSLFPDASGVWIGTSEGLCRLENDRFRHYSSADGLVEDRVSSILDDNQGHLWLSGYRGFSRIPTTALLDYRPGASPRLPVWFLEHANGEPTSNGFQMRSAWKAQDGRLWFASLRGLIRIDPATARPDPLPVPVVIEAFLADRMPALGAKPRLPAGVRDLEFRFVGLNLGNPSGVRFKYQLEGYDPDWMDAGSRREAFYTNLPSGTYTFRVAAANSDGVWSPNAAVLTFLKEAHFYELWWMRVLFAAAVCGIIWLVYRSRVEGMHRQFAAVLAERNRIARELHDTVEQGMTGVMLQLDTVSVHWKAAPEKAEQGLELARSMTRHCMAEARNAVRDLRTENQNDVVAALRRMALEFATAGAPEIQVEVQGPPAVLPRDAATTLLRIGQEALTNAIKHARATKIEIAVFFDPRGVALRVCDDGIGFSPQPSLATAASGHFGLLGMRERANKIRGELEIRSGHNGTIVDFRLPRQGV